MIELDGRRMGERAELHEELKRKLSLPDYYGGNLDALNDCLGERAWREPVVIRDAGAFLEIGPYALRLLRVFCDNGVRVTLDGEQGE